MFDYFPAIAMNRNLLLLTIIGIYCVDGISTATNVADIKPNEAESLPSLGSFVVNGTLLTTWSSNLRKDTEDIDLRNLGIDKLGKSTFEKFHALNKLDLSSNRVTSSKDVVIAFESIMPSSLNISHNFLQGYFNEHDSDMRPWSPATDPFNPKFFWSIDISYNFLTGIGMEFDVAYLNLSNNLFQCTDAIRTGRDYPNEIYVGNLDLSHNFINCQKGFITSTIDTLDLSYNRLTGLDAGLLRGLERLTVLNLSNNRIRYISPRAFEDNSSLQKLDLGFNEIRSIYKWVWFPTRALKDIRLPSNQLEYLEWETAWISADQSIYVDVTNNSEVQWSQKSKWYFVFDDHENHL